MYAIARQSILMTNCGDANGLWTISTLEFKTTTDRIDLQNVSLEMANVGVIDGYLCRQLGIDGAEGMFSSARSLLEAIRDNAVSAEIAQRAKTMLEVMNGGGI